MTTDTQDFSHLRALAAKAADRHTGIWSDYVQMMEAYHHALNPATVIALLDKLDALQAQVAQCLKERDAYATALAACRDAFPVPDAGSRLDDWYCSAMADPLEVPEYVKACVGASPVEPAQPKLEQVLLDTALLINERPELRATFLEMWGAQPSQAGELSQQEAEALAHRRASKYAHRSDPSYVAYTFLPHTLMDFVRDVTAAINAKESGA